MFAAPVQPPWLGGILLEVGAAMSGQDLVAYGVLALLCVAVFVGHVLRARIRALLPDWLQPFAPEEDPGTVNRRAWTRWTVFLGIVALAGLVLAIVPVFIRPPEKPLPVIVDVTPWLLAVLMTAFERPVRTPRLLLLLYLLIVGTSIAAYALQILDDGPRSLDPCRLGRLAAAAAAAAAIAAMPLRDPSWPADDIGIPQLPPKNGDRSPEDGLSLFSFWTFSWMAPLARIARHRELAVEDVWQLPLEFQHGRLYLAFRELRGRLVACLVRANGLDMVVSCGLAVAVGLAEVSNIRLTARLYASLDARRPREAVLWCLLMLAIDLARQLARSASSWYGRKAYERSRGEAFIALFGKLLTRAVSGSDKTEKGPAARPDTGPGRLRRRRGRGSGAAPSSGDQRPRAPSSKEAQDAAAASNAKIINLVRGDAYDIAQRFWDFPLLVSQPVKVFVAMYYLVDIMGWVSCVGFGLMALFLLINSLLVAWLIRMERVRTALSDRRAQAVAHFVEASRPLKLNGWTAAWHRRITDIRLLEMRQRLSIARVSAIVATINVAGGSFYPLVSICLYTLMMRRGLPNDVIWPSLQLFAQLESSVKEAFALIAGFWKSTIPVQRVHKFMAEPDRDAPPADGAGPGSGFGAGCDIEFRGASFAWPAAPAPVLRDLDLRFPPGLTVIRGPVGAGKSSLLLAALNEMELRGGCLTRPDAPIGYAQQLPWLQTGTVRDNILFHHAFDAARYRQVLHACALTPDLAILSGGDQYRVEEGGIGLSGGQRARVALARAVYSPTRVLLLDDPLAALDHDTASSIVGRLLCGPLTQDRTVVIVTHREDLVLGLANQVVNVDAGRATVLSRAQIDAELARPASASGSGSGSSSSAGPAPQDPEPEPTGPTDDGEPEEAAETGRVPLSVYLGYVRAGGWRKWALLALLFAASRCFDVARARLLEAWGGRQAYRPGADGSAPPGFWGLPDPETRPGPWIGVLAGLSGGQTASFAAASLVLGSISVVAARAIFAAAVDCLSRASFRYLDVTSSGQLKNRLISDVSMVDGGVMAPLQDFVFNTVALTLSIAAVAEQQPLLLIVLVAIALLFTRFFRSYVPVSRCLRRMEMRYLTPIIANIGVLQDGLVTIRAMRAEPRFQERHLVAVDDFQKHDHFFWSAAFWLEFRMGLSSSCARAGLVLAMLLLHTPASVIGFVLAQAATAMDAVHRLCDSFARLQLDAVSLERLAALRRIPEEPAADGGSDPPEDWPRPCDAIRFDTVTWRYAPELPAVLDGVSFEIPGGSSCAVLGRTGSGKSTIANALLVTQMASEGTISIGGIDLARVDRAKLRGRVTFIQQDPTLFPGTLRDNLDPEGRFSDPECRNAIHRVLGPAWDLESPVDAGGRNLSQGQRQLVGIGRAILRRSGLVILDEATAAIDRATAATVQRILREELCHSTVITIAHRLEAVEDADWCLRLDRGRVVDCGAAKGLRRRPRIVRK